MRLHISLVSALFLGIVAGAQAQDTVCDLFKDLKANDGRQVVVRGEMFLDGKLAALGATECETRYQSRVPAPFVGFQEWPTAIELQPSTAVPKKELEDLKDRAAKIHKFVADGQTVAAYGTFSGRLTLQTDGSMPARLTFDDARDLTVEALPPAEALPVIPICDLFQDLSAWKDKRIAVRAEIVSTGEGTWLSGRCKGNFFTDGHRWPVLLTWGWPDYYAGGDSLFRIHRSRMNPTANAPAEIKGYQNVINIATYVGRLRMRDKYVGVCRAAGDFIGNGFGHLNAAAAELIVESVRDAEVQPRLEREDTEAREPSCVPPNHAELCSAATTLKDAATDDCPQLVEKLLATKGLDTKNGEPSAALAAAIRTGHESIALLLIKAGAPANPVTTDARSKPLFLAAHWSRLKTLEALIKAGGDVNEKDHTGTTWLASFGYFDIGVSKVLLEAGADANARDDTGATPLMHASHYGYEDEVKLLLEHRADVNLKDNHGRTALMYAAEGQYVDAISLLLAKGADPLWRDIDGRRALDLAKKSGNAEAINLIESAIGKH